MRRGPFGTHLEAVVGLPLALAGVPLALVGVPLALAGVPRALARGGAGESIVWSGRRELESVGMSAQCADRMI